MSCKNLTKPCEDCAFLRRSTPGNLGGSHPEVYIGQVWGNEDGVGFAIPCHTPGDYAGKASTIHAPACAGVAEFRANIGRDKFLPKKIERLPADHVNVFSTCAEFLAHHYGISLEMAQDYLATPGYMPSDWYCRELLKSEVRILHVEERTNA